MCLHSVASLLAHLPHGVIIRFGTVGVVGVVAQEVGGLLIRLLAAAVPLVVVLAPRLVAVVLVRPGPDTGGVLEVLIR